MDLDALLGIDPDDPIEQNAQQLVEADEKLLDDLIALRRSQGLRQAQVAERLGVAQSSVARIESGERDPHLSTLRRYALALGARVEHHVRRFDPSDVGCRCTCESRSHAVEGAAAAASILSKRPDPWGLWTDEADVAELRRIALKSR